MRATTPKPDAYSADPLITPVILDFVIWSSDQKLYLRDPLYGSLSDPQVVFKSTYQGRGLEFYGPIPFPGKADAPKPVIRTAVAPIRHIGAPLLPGQTL